MQPVTRRMYRRVETDYQACYVSGAAFRSGVIRDLSLNGLRVGGHSSFGRDAIIMLRLWLPHGGGNIDIDQALVRWVTPHEFGVQIIALSNEADLRLARHVEDILQRPDLHRVAS